MAVVTSVAGRLQQEDIEAESSAGDMIAAEVDALEPGKQ